MHLGDESLKLMGEVSFNKNVKTDDLQTSFGLSRRQVDYRFKKINRWLLENNLPKIDRTRQGQFIVDPLVQSLVIGEKEVPIQHHVPNSEERAHLLLLLILSMKEEFSLNHFLIELKVSKNTVLKDLKVAKEILSPYDLSIQFSRKNGYFLSGTEFNIRRLLIQTVKNVLKMIGGDEWFVQLTDVDVNQLNELYKKLETVENGLDLKFTDEKIYQMPYVLSIIFKRIQKGALVEDFSISYHELLDSKEYKASEKLLNHIKNVPVEEKLFITLKLLSTNVSSSTLIEEVIPELKEAINEMLIRFERVTLIELQDKPQLLNKILLHIQPAYYRIAYQLTSMPSLQPEISLEFQDLHHLVKRAAEPLEDFLKVNIPEEESSYLTILIGGWMTRQGDSIQHKPRAVIVCPNGVSVSKYLHSTLTKLFPEFLFMDALSVREFKNYNRDFQVIFSPTHLETDKMIFIVEPFLSSEQKRKLRRKVFKQLDGVPPSLLDWDKVVHLISQHATIHNREELINSLAHYIYQEDDWDLNLEDSTPALMNLVKPETILLQEHVETFEEAIRVAAKPLVQKGDITKSYVDQMVEIQHTVDPYAILGRSIAIPHARMEDGVNRLSMSLLKIDKGLKISSDIHIHFIVVIAPDSSGNHLRALQHLEKVSESEEALTELWKANTKNELWKIIKKFTS